MQRDRVLTIWYCYVWTSIWKLWNQSNLNEKTCSGDQSSVILWPKHPFKGSAKGHLSPLSTHSKRALTHSKVSPFIDVVIASFCRALWQKITRYPYIFLCSQEKATPSSWHFICCPNPFYLLYYIEPDFLFAWRKPCSHLTSEESRCLLRNTLKFSPQVLTRNW